MGGEQDIRGFEIWGITPIAFIPLRSSVSIVYNDNGTPRTPEGRERREVVETPGHA
jgi:outer membrane protein insertion porin family